jgi:tetratricopeptide (TPR) repeat protein
MLLACFGTSMKRAWTTIGICALLCVLGKSGIAGQALQDGPTPSPTLGPVRALPLTPELRTTVQEGIKARDYETVEKLLAAEIERKPNSPELLKFLASVFFLDQKYLNTAIALKKAEAISPLDNSSRFTLALAYIILNHRDWARPELETLIKADPRNALYPYWLGRINYDAMQFTAAVANLKKAQELDPAYMKVYDNLGLCYEALGNYDEAINTYQEAIRRNRELPAPSPWPPLNLGTLLVKLRRLEEAETVLKESLQYDPRFPQAHYQMGLLLEKQKKDDEAVAELRQAATLNPAYAEPHYVLGRIFQRQGDSKNAEAAWATFQKLKVENPKDRPH